MKNSFSIVLVALLLGGCAPKIGKDILIEPQGNIRWENSQSEVMLGVLSLLGIVTKGGEIRLGSDLTVINKWHSDLKILSLDYTLGDGKEIFAQGEAKKVGSKPFLIPSGGEINIPLDFRIEAKQLNSNRVLGMLQSKRKLYVKGRVIIEIWGIEKDHFFEKEVTTVIQKALKGV
jgi:hypothetical protein